MSKASVYTQSYNLNKPLLSASASLNSSKMNSNSSSSLSASAYSNSGALASSPSGLSSTNSSPSSSSSSSTTSTSSIQLMNKLNNDFNQHVNISNNLNGKSFKAQASPSVYATLSSTTASNSTGTAASILNSIDTADSSILFDGDDRFDRQQVERQNSANNKPNGQKKLERLEFLSTVGTGTFGRVIVVKDKMTKEFYALKIMSIAEVLRLKQTDHVKNEKDILSQVKHPFIINLYWTFHNEKFLYMLLEYVCGGELFSYLRNAVKFPNDTATFYAAEIVSALEYLHSLNVIYRDLKPENLLLDKHGHVRICDFGFAKRVHDRTWTLCGTPEYLAPEIIQGKGHHKAVDWWALGILIYEMLAGYPPFYDENPFQIYQKILAGKIDWPRHIDLVAKDLIRKLLVNDRTKRLGSMKNGPDDIRRHKWFKNIDWDQAAQKKLEPPIIPKVSHDGDTKNFDKYDEEGWRDVPTVSTKSLQSFEDF